MILWMKQWNIPHPVHFQRMAAQPGNHFGEIKLDLSPKIPLKSTLLCVYVSFYPHIYKSEWHIEIPIKSQSQNMKYSTSNA